MNRHDILLVQYPNHASSTYAEDRCDAVAEHVVDELQAAPYVQSVKVVETPGPEYNRNVEHIAKAIEPGMTVLSARGDGMAHLAANGILLAATQEPEIARTANLLALPAGNANDWSQSVYGRNILQDDRFMRHLRDGEPHAMTTIRTTWEADSGQETRDAIAYATLGMTAMVAGRFNDGSYRHARSGWPLLDDLRDAWTAAKALRKHEPFDIVREYRHGAAAYQVQELAWVGVQRFAKHARWQVEATSPEVLAAEFPAEGFIPHVAGQLVLRGAGGGLLRTGLRGRVLQETDRLHLPQQAQRTMPLYAQLDGEAFRVKPDTTLTVGRRHEAFNTLLLTE